MSATKTLARENGTDKAPREALARAGVTELPALQRPLENQCLLCQRFKAQLDFVPASRASFAPYCRRGE